jgi:hypothetical protein
MGYNNSISGCENSYPSIVFLALLTLLSWCTDRQPCKPSPLPGLLHSLLAVQVDGGYHFSAARCVTSVGGLQHRMAQACDAGRTKVKESQK